MKKEVIQKLLNDKKNVLIYGKMATGKTGSIGYDLMDEIITKEESFLVVDAKEEYISKYYETVNERGYNTLVLNLRDLEASDGYNPLSYPYSLYKEGKKDQAIEYIEEITKEIFYEDDSNADPFWATSASDFTTGIILGLFEDAKEEEIHFNSIAAFYNNGIKKFGTSNYMIEYFKKKENNTDIYNYASSTAFAPKETRDSIIAIARQKLKLYIARNLLNRFLSKSTFQFDDILNKKTAIFVITKDENVEMNSLATIFIKQLYKVLFAYQDKKFNLLLDNFDTLAHINDLNSLLASAPSRNKQFIIITRSIKDIENRYSSYIYTLNNLVAVDENNITYLIDNQTQKEENEKKENQVKVKKVQYRNLENDDCKIFDLISFVKEQKKQSLLEMMKEEDKKENRNMDYRNVNGLIEQIDEKLEELNKEALEMKQEKGTGLQELINHLINIIREKKETEQFTTCTLLTEYFHTDDLKELTYNGIKIEDNLFEIHNAILEKCKLEHIELEPCFLSGAIIGLPYNYEYKKKSLPIEESLEEMVSNKEVDPYFINLITSYLKDELGQTDSASKRLFTKLSKYDDIYNEFIKYLQKRSYDFDNAICINGYRANDIARLNPNFNGSGVYCFLVTLRDNKEEAEAIIQAGFPRK